MKSFVPGQKGIRPTFTVDPAKQLKLRSREPVYLLPDMELYYPPVYSWEKSNHEIERIRDMDPYNIIQILRTMADQGIKYSRCWYIFDQALRKKGVAMTGRMTKVNGGRPVVIAHGANYGKVS